ncbi:MAG: DUF1289 domain-containing protein [Rickettsiales bacterium]|nr:DUF1289 domain-containing protein [Rickettsiales bacterium]|tara:strand:- start:91 stop:264 length:174 start_codon:yes stop_codon:yes gene_type:complete
MIESPCLGICSIINGECIGCRRTSSEISNWLYYNDKERSRITKRCLKEIRQTMKKRN